MQRKTKIKLIAALLFVGVVVAQNTRVLVDQQLRVSQKVAPGSVLVVGDDGESVVIKQWESQTFVAATPEEPGCRVPTFSGTNRAGVVSSDAGIYRLPRKAKAVIVWRMGLRAMTPGEFTFTNGDTVTLAKPIPNELVACDYVY